MGRTSAEVKLEITSTRKFQDICLLIDREDFRLNLEKLSREIHKLWRLHKDKLASYLNYGEELRLATQLLSKYKYPPGFAPAIIKAAKREAITDKDLVDCYSKIIPYGIVEAGNIPYYPKQNEIIISIYPYILTGHKNILVSEMKQALSQAKKLIKPLPKTHPLSIDIKPKIKEARIFYWAKKDGIPTEQILKWLNENSVEEKLINDPNFIDQQTSEYSRLLKLSF